MGVIINNRLSSQEHVQEKVRNMHNLLGNMRVAFTYINEKIRKKMITSFIRPTLEYAAVLWNSNLKKHIKKIEKAQRAATRWVSSLRDLSYEERLKKLQLSTLTERRERGDMIMLYKCVEGIEKKDINEYVIPKRTQKATQEKAKERC